MRVVIFGLTISSSWGNGHATIWRALCRALAARGHRLVFFERDVPYYAAHRDYAGLAGVELRLYPSWEAASAEAAAAIAACDVGLVTSYCPDAVPVSELLLERRSGRVFYDLDTPVTLACLEAREPVSYLPPGGLAGFDLVLSYTGGEALERLCTRLGAGRVAPLYGCADPLAHHPSAPADVYRSDLSYLGTYAADRQQALAELFVGAAGRLPGSEFLIGGSLYPEDFPWRANIRYVRHVPPPEHPAFYGSSRFTLSVTRAPMAALGYCPSGRLFEAAACGTPVITDGWEGLPTFFEPGEEIVVASTRDEVVAALTMPEPKRAALAAAARRRALDEHSAERRGAEFEALLAEARG